MNNHNLWKMSKHTAAIENNSIYLHSKIKLINKMTPHSYVLCDKANSLRLQLPS